MTPQWLFLPCEALITVHILLVWMGWAAVKYNLTFQHWVRCYLQARHWAGKGHFTEPRNVTCWRLIAWAPVFTCLPLRRILSEHQRLCSNESPQRGFGGIYARNQELNFVRIAGQLNQAAKPGVQTLTPGILIQERMSRFIPRAPVHVVGTALICPLGQDPSLPSPRCSPRLGIR